MIEIIEIKNVVLNVDEEKNYYYGQVKKGTKEPFGFHIVNTER